MNWKNSPFSLTYSFFSLPLRKPLSIKKGITIKERKGIILKLHHKKLNITTYGECSPLEGLHQETLRDIQHLLDNHFFSSSTLPPSLLFALEQAFFLQDIIKKKISLPQQVLTNSLFFIGDLKNQKKKKGTIKIKLGRNSFLEEKKILFKFLEENPQVKIRLDANDFLLPQKLDEMIDIIPPSQLEYVEDYSGKRKDIPLALDEQLHLIKDIHDFPLGTKAIIIKPTLFGLTKTFELIKNAKKQKIKTILSSTYDSNYTINTYHLIIKKFHLQKLAHGLATLPFFDEQLFSLPNNFATRTPPHFFSIKDLKLKRKLLANL